MALFIRLDTMERAKQFTTVCNMYEDIDVDVIHGRQIVDGKSLLGVASLVDKIVRIEFIPYGNDTSSIMNDLKEIGAYEV